MSKKLIFIFLFTHIALLAGGFVLGAYGQGIETDKVREEANEYNNAREMNFTLLQNYADLAKSWRKADLLCINSYNAVITGKDTEAINQNIKERDGIIGSMDSKYGAIGTLLKQRQETKYKYLDVNYWEIPIEEL